AGIGLALILRCLLGLRLERDRLVIDPVMPPVLDGLQAGLRLMDHELEVTYRIRRRGWGPRTLTINGVGLAFERGDSPYRTGAAEVPLEAFRAGLTAGLNRLGVELG
ncbi:MAG: hypothetical protein ACM3ST_17535, partial [Bdellovibrio bacteriovorus]